MEKTQEEKSSIQFESNLKKLLALTNEIKAESKLPNDDVGLIIKEIVKERKIEKINQFKKDVSSLLLKKIEFDKECKKLEEDYKNTVIKKKKEFSEEMQKLFSNVENINKIEEEYYQTLKGV